MKFLILACFLGFAAASFLEHAAPVVDETVNAMMDGMSRSGSLRSALDMPDVYELDEFEDDIKTEMSKVLKEKLNEILEKIKDRVEHGKQVAFELLDKAKEMHDKMKDLHIDMGNKAKDLIKNIKEKTKDVMNSLWEKFKEKMGLSGKQTRNLDQIMDEVARFNFKDFVEKLKEKLLNSETIRKIREYVKNIASNNHAILKFKELIAKLRDVDIKELIDHLLHLGTGRDVRSVAVAMEKIKEFFKQKHLAFKDHWAKFGEWVKDTWTKGLEKVKDKHQLIKAIALEFIAHAKDVSSEICREALEFFQPYKQDLGALWGELVQIAINHIGHGGY